MKIFDFYIFKTIAIATIFVSISLSAIILLTQSLRFLELVIEAGASSSTFWVLTILALPRFFEIIVPIAFLSGILFVYNRMTMDSEIVVMRATGYAPMALARPVLVLSLLVSVFLWSMTLWAAPKSLWAMKELRQVIKAQFSTSLFREGVFNNFGSGLTLYIRERGADGELIGIMMHDTRDPETPPTTILAERGTLSLTDKGYEVIAYDGARQAYKKSTDEAERGILQNLQFKQYKIELPDSRQARIRWQEPDERTLPELLTPNFDDPRDIEALRDFKVDLHRRIVTPLLAPVFALIALACMMTGGAAGRRGQGWSIMSAVLLSTGVQGAYIASFNIARNSDLGLIIMYGLIALPIMIGFVMLSPLRDTIIVPQITKLKMMLTPSLGKEASS